MMDVKYWDQLAGDFSSQVLEISERDNDNIIASVAKQLGGQRKTATDFGCGPGALTRSIAPFFKKVRGVDFSAPLIQTAKRKTTATNVSYNVAELQRADLSQYRCDVGFCANVLIDENENIREQITKNVVNAIRKGGHAVFIVPAFESVIREFQVLLQCQIKGGHSLRPAARETDNAAKKDIASISRGIVSINGVPTKYFMRDELAELMTRHGLKNIQIDRISYPWEEVLEDIPSDLDANPPWDWIGVGSRG